MNKVKFIYRGPAHAAELITPRKNDAERETVHSGWLAPGMAIEIEASQVDHPTVAVWLARGWLAKADDTAPASPPAADPSTPIADPSTDVAAASGSDAVASNSGRRRG